MKASPAVLADCTSCDPVNALTLGAGQLSGSIGHSEMRSGGMSGHTRKASIKSCTCTYI